jgi:hypothetical protein
VQFDTNCRFSVLFVVLGVVVVAAAAAAAAVVSSASMQHGSFAMLCACLLSLPKGNGTR